MSLVGLTSNIVCSLIMVERPGGKWGPSGPCFQALSPIDIQQPSATAAPLCLPIGFLSRRHDLVPSGLSILFAPILPGEYHKRGIDVQDVGAVFAIYSVAVLVVTPLISGVTGFGPRVRMLLLGLGLQGASAVLFGYAPAFVGEQSGSADGILLLQLATRAVGGVGQALSNLAIFSMVADEFVSDLGFVMGLNEVIIGFGFSAGPPVGSWLELLGGFHFPFLVSGLTILLVTIPVVLALRAEKRRLEDVFSIAESTPAVETTSTNLAAPTPLLAILRRPGVLLPSGFLFLGTFVFGLVEPIYAIHAKSALGLGLVSVGYMYAVLSVCYSVFGVPVGWFADRYAAKVSRKTHTKAPSKVYLYTLMLGALLSGAALWLFSQYESLLIIAGYSRAVIEDENEEVLKTECEAAILVLLGLGQAALLVPTLPAMKAGAAGVGGDESESETDRIVALFLRTGFIQLLMCNIFQQGGLIAGPMAGAWLRSAVGFETTMLIGAVVVFGYLCGAVGWTVRSMEPDEVD
eukprot:g4768.t1